MQNWVIGRTKGEREGEGGGAIRSGLAATGMETFISFTSTSRTGVCIHGHENSQFPLLRLYPTHH